VSSKKNKKSPVKKNFSGGLFICLKP